MEIFYFVLSTNFKQQTEMKGYSKIVMIFKFLRVAIVITCAGWLKS